LLQREILILAIDEAPNFIGLHTTNAKVANVGIVVGRAYAANFLE
jgi:hypothetical protein